MTNTNPKNNNPPGKTTKDIIKKVKKIEFKVNSHVDSLIYGAYKSRFRGHGMEFSEVREYRVGDDIRTIDWNVTARMGHPFVKEFIEKRDLCVYVVFDISGSLDFGTQNTFKKDIGIELIASIAFMCLRNNDRIGLVLSSDRIEKHFPARKGRRHIFSMIHTLAECTPKGKGTDLSVPLAYLAKVLKRKSIIFLISDFMDDIGRVDTALKALAKCHDIIAVSIEDLRELVMPDIGLIELEDEETGEQLMVNTSDAEFLKEYSKVVTEHKTAIRKMFQKRKIDTIKIDTKDDWVKPVLAHFQKRKHMKQR